MWSPGEWSVQPGWKRDLRTSTCCFFRACNVPFASLPLETSYASVEHFPRILDFWQITFMSPARETGSKLPHGGTVRELFGVFATEIEASRSHGPQYKPPNNRGSHHKGTTKRTPNSWKQPNVYTSIQGA